MKLQTVVNKPIESSGVKETASYHIDPQNIVHITQILRNMYSDPVEAVIRELAANAVDAHQQIGIADKPITIVLPTDEHPVFKVIDYGPGLNKEDTTKLLLGYGSSGDHKRNSNDQIGGFGIGCKCPFAISDMFTYIIRHDGVERTWSCYLDDKDMGQASLINEKPTKETGIEVQVPLNGDRIYQFSDTRTTFQYWKVQPNIYMGEISSGNLVTDWPVAQPADEALTGSMDAQTEDGVVKLNWWISPHERARTLYGQDPNPSDIVDMVVMGGLGYKVNRRLLGLDAAKTPAGKFTLFAPIGFVQLAPNREELQYSKMTQKRLRTVFEAFASEKFTEALLKKFLDKKGARASAFDRYLAHNTIFGTYRPKAEQLFPHLTPKQIKDQNVRAAFQLPDGLQLGYSWVHDGPSLAYAGDPPTLELGAYNPMCLWENRGDGQNTRGFLGCVIVQQGIAKGMRTDTGKTTHYAVLRPSGALTDNVNSPGARITTSLIGHGSTKTKEGVITRLRYMALTDPEYAEFLAAHPGTNLQPWVFAYRSTDDPDVLIDKLIESEMGKCIGLTKANAFVMPELKDGSPEAKKAAYGDSDVEVLKGRLSLGPWRPSGVADDDVGGMGRASITAHGRKLVALKLDEKVGYTSTHSDYWNPLKAVEVNGGLYVEMDRFLVQCPRGGHNRELRGNAVAALVNSLPIEIFPNEERRLIGVRTRDVKSLQKDKHFKLFWDAINEHLVEEVEASSCNWQQLALAADLLSYNESTYSKTTAEPTTGRYIWWLTLFDLVDTWNLPDTHEFMTVVNTVKSEIQPIVQGAIPGHLLDILKSLMHCDILSFAKTVGKTANDCTPIEKLLQQKWSHFFEEFATSARSYSYHCSTQNKLLFDNELKLCKMSPMLALSYLLSQETTGGVSRALQAAKADAMPQIIAELIQVGVTGHDHFAQKKRKAHPAKAILEETTLAESIRMEITKNTKAVI